MNEFHVLAIEQAPFDQAFIFLTSPAMHWDVQSWLGHKTFSIFTICGASEKRLSALLAQQEAGLLHHGLVGDRHVPPD